MWTRPVPSSVVTKSPARTGKAAAARGRVELEDRALVAAADQVGAGEARRATSAPSPSTFSTSGSARIRISPSTRART